MVKAIVRDYSNIVKDQKGEITGNMYLLMGDKQEKTLQFRIRKTSLFSKTIYLVIFIDTSEQRKIQSLEQRAKFKQLMLG